MERLRDSHILVHSTDAQHRQSRARMKPGTKSCFQGLQAAGAQALGPPPATFPRALVGSWVRSGVART